MSNKATIYKTKNLTVRYLIALFLIASLMVAAYTLIRISLYKQASDSRVINLSGRQRMLSQKLTKEVLLLVQSETPEMKENYRELLRVTLASWSKVHMGLQYGDEELNLPGNNSQEVQNLFAEIEPHYRIIKSSADKILALRSIDLKPLSIRTPLVNNIVEASPLYLGWMDRTVFQYDKEAQGRVDRLKRLEAFILTAVLLLLSLVALLIFRPMVSRVRRSYRDFQRANEQLKQEITERRTAESLIKEQNERLKDEVDERKRAEEKTRGYSAELQSANNDLEAFSYSVSHDLRAPLRAIDGFSHMLLENHREVLNKEGRRILDVIRDNTGRMGRLIDDLLSFSRLGRKEVTKKDIDMEKMVKDISKEVKALDPERKFEMKVNALPFACGDESLIREVLINLLSNAIRFSKNEKGSVIEVGGRLEKDENIYYVKDNGVGFDMKYSDKLFGVFQRLHSQQEFKGTGVGLALVQRIIYRHGGRVWAEGKVNKGATFYFTLPLRKEKGKEDEK